MKRQSGFTTFTITLILLLILLAVSLLVGKLLVADRRVTLNEAMYRQVMALAEQGLSYGFGRLSSEGLAPCSSPPSWWTGTTVSPSGGGGSYTLTVTCMTPFPVVAGGTTPVTPIRIRSVASLNNSQAEASVEAQYVQINTLAGAPSVPLVVADGLSGNGSFTVVANPNGGGLGVPVSIWTKDPININGNFKTCYQGCSTDLSSKDVGKNLDIKDDDSAFPASLLWYLFNEQDNATGWANLASRASKVATNCTGLGPASTGLIIVTGNCSVGDIGSQSNPVVLIVKDGDVVVGNVYGLVFSYSSNPSTTTQTIKLNGSSVVNGAIVANYDPSKHANGGFKTIFDGTVMSNIMNGAAFQTLKQVPGSWRDW